MQARFWALVLAAGALATWGGDPSWAATADVAVVLELSQDYYYEGDPLLVRISVRNSGPTTVDNPVSIRLIQGLKARHAEGTRLRPASPGNVREPNRPDKLAPQSFYGSLIDISGMYPETLKAGHYELLWEGDGLQSQLLSARVIPAFDAGQDYFGEIVTQVGTIRVDLFEDRSPIAVKAFVDLAQAGYYDGLGIDEVRQDQLITGGGALPGRRPFVFPAEQSDLPLSRGTVVMVPTSAAPPANGSGFMILLSPQPAWAGQVTVLGQVVQGIETAIALSKTPSSGVGGSPPFRPLSPVRIEKVLVSIQKTGAAALGAGTLEQPGGAQESVDLFLGSPYIQTH